MKAATKVVNIMELQVGNVVHSHGARFEIVSAKTVTDRTADNNGPIMCAMGKWLDGRTETGYFGPGKDWNFQGNRNVNHTVEA